MKSTILILSIFLVATAAYGQKTIDVKSVKTNAGLIAGKTNKTGDVKIFMGIPYAAPPVGELRWKAPQPVSKWQKIRQCITFPASATQAKPSPFFCWSKEFMAPEEPLSEDCLYLNIWTSAKKSDEKLPVIVWIHGGAFNSGSGTVPLYDGEELSRKGVVYITINYRLGIFGFFAHPALSAESPNKASGNYGILDQIEALKWVKENISAFGGNPDNVTIAGQSAGAFSVNVLMVSPLAKGLFHRAIAQSGGMFKNGFGMVQSLTDAEGAGITFAEKNGFTSLKDLRSKPASELFALQGRWAPIIDNVVIPPVYETFEAGKQNDVPLLTGWNADDGVMFGPAQSAESFKSEAVKKYGTKSELFLQLFPAQNDDEAKNSQKLQSQLSFGWQNYFWAKMQSSKGKSKAWLYYFKRVPPGEPNYGAFHSAEFAYALKTLKFWNRPFTEWDFELAETMSSFWVNFAKSGNPNGAKLPVWSAFEIENPNIIELGDKVKSESLPYSEQLYFMDDNN